MVFWGSFSVGRQGRGYHPQIRSGNVGRERLRLVFAVFQLVAVKAGNADVAGNLESSRFKISIVLDIMMSY
jgi:hypothetical protein